MIRVAPFARLGTLCVAGDAWPKLADGQPLFWVGSPSEDTLHSYLDFVVSGEPAPTGTKRRVTWRTAAQGSVAAAADGCAGAAVAEGLAVPRGNDSAVSPPPAQAAVRANTRPKTSKRAGRQRAGGGLHSLGPER